MTAAKVIYILLALCTRDPNAGQLPFSTAEAQHYAEAYLIASSSWGLDWQVPLATGIHENQWCDPNLVSPTRDVGLMQVHTTGRPRHVEAYKDPRYNTMRGCEILCSARWTDKPCKTDACYTSWFQGYNPGAKGYGARLLRSLRRVQRVARRYDKAVEALQGLKELQGWGERLLLPWRQG